MKIGFINNKYMFYYTSFCLIRVCMLPFKQFILKNTLKTRGVKKSFAFFSEYIIMANNVHWTYYQRNKELVISKAKEYYKNNKDRLSKQAREKYQGLPEEEKDKNRKYRINKYHAMSDEEKNKRKEYQRNRYRNMTEEQTTKKREYTRNRYNALIKVC